MEPDQVIYPVARILANPRTLYAIANIFDGPDVDTLQEAFYDALEFKIREAEDPDDYEFDCTEVCFRLHDNGDFEIIFDNGVQSVLQIIEGESKASITNDAEWAASTAIYQVIVDAIGEAEPDLAGNIALCSPPTPGNGYLRSHDGEHFEGSFHLLTDPEKLYAFHINIIDVTENKLQALIKPIN
jgi:hypothetical protein